MTNDNEQEIRTAVIDALEPYRALCERLIALCEKLTARVEVLELEVLAARDCTPNAPPTADPPL